MRYVGGEVDSDNFHFSRNPITFWFVSLPSYLVQIILGESIRLYHQFSIPELSRTIFAPWKRDEVSTDNLSIGDRVNVIVGNLASRLVAVIIRSMTILIGFGAMGAYAVIGFAVVIGQVLLPLWAVVLIMLGLGVI